jgi:hypothetical protein
MAATRNPPLRELLADHRARLVAVVGGILAAVGAEHSDARAEALVAAYDGVLLAAMLRPADQRRAFLSRSLELVGGALAGRPGE